MLEGIVGVHPGAPYRNTDVARPVLLELLNLNTGPRRRRQLSHAKNCVVIQGDGLSLRFSCDRCTEWQHATASPSYLSAYWPLRITHLLMSLPPKLVASLLGCSRKLLGRMALWQRRWQKEENH